MRERESFLTEHQCVYNLFVYYNSVIHCIAWTMS